MNNSLVKEAENIINEYIRENRYNVLPERRRKARARLPGKRVFLIAGANILALGIIAVLILIIGRLI